MTDTKRLSLHGRLRMASVVRGPDTDLMIEAADRIEAQAAEIERLKYDGIHSCHDQCARPLCVAWREIEHLKDVYSSATECFLEADAENERLREALRDVTPPTYFGESEQNKAWWAKARAALGEKK